MDCEILIISCESILVIAKYLIMLSEEREEIFSKLRGSKRLISHTGYFIFRTTKYNIRIRCYSQFDNSNAFQKGNHAKF